MSEIKMRHFLNIYIQALERRNNRCFYVHKRSQLVMLLSDRGTWQLVKDVHVKEEEQAAEEVYVLKDNRIRDKDQGLIKEGVLVNEAHNAKDEDLEIKEREKH
uniref:Uncharacterized protein n=1 Tax=Meloidogyne enterolobii TaxID=390850 RepID=A0A6V7XFM2_MELEN|nr:unnamed protein product [Meloidogyne enterolobii]